MKSTIHKIAGYCPMGCGQTLEHAAGGLILCGEGSSCPDPVATTRLLEDSETEHVVTFDEDSFTLRHPLRERIDGQLEQCRWHSFLAAYDRPPVEIGQYRMTSASDSTVEWGTVHWERI